MNAAERAADAVAHRMGGGVQHSGGDYRVRCPVHGGEDHNLSIRNGSKGADIVVRCHSHQCDPKLILRAIADLVGREPREERRSPPIVQPIAMPDRAKVERVLALCHPIRGTVVETYLRQFRGVDLPSADDALRFLPAKPPHYPHPAMAAVVTDFTDASRVMTVQFTFLRSDGMGKASDTRPFLRGCPARGGVVRLVEDAEITDRLGLAEGVESALAVMSRFGRSGYVVPPVWAALSAGNLARLPVLPAIEVLNIFADGDAHDIGQRAALELARTWRDAGRETLIASRPEGGDWNDL